MAKWRKRRGKPTGEEWTPKGRVSDEELLNRVILTKALEVYASDQTLHLRTKEGDFEITPRVAMDVMRAARRLPAKTRKKKQSVKFEKRNPRN